MPIFTSRTTVTALLLALHYDRIMPLYIGNKQVTNQSIGNKEVAKMFFGDKEVDIGGGGEGIQFEIPADWSFFSNPGPVGAYENTYATHAKFFKNCPQMTSCSLPNCEAMSVSPFTGCTSLTTLYIGTNKNTVCSIDETLTGASPVQLPESVTAIYVPASLVDAYKASDGWANYVDIIFGI